jgi:hypothetical protein
MIFLRCILSCAGSITLVILFVTTTDCAAADSFSKFGIIRANIAKYIGDQRWLVCYEPRDKGEIENGEVAKTEVVGFDAMGNFFTIRGDLRPSAVNLLSLESYEQASVAFSTLEGYFYVWNTGDSGNPFESFLKLKEYENLIEKFELYPLLGEAKDALLKFEILKENPEFYNRALALPRPKSGWHLENPTSKRVRVGIFFARKPSNDGCLVQGVADNSVAKASDIRPGDIIGNLVLDGTEVEMEKHFPLPVDKFIRLLSLKVLRRSDEDGISILNINVFLPSAFEYFLHR